MNTYPGDYVAHNLPLILLSGLDSPRSGTAGLDAPRTLLQEGGFRIRTELPTVTGNIAEELLGAFLQNDSSEAPWNNLADTKERTGSFRIRSIGRVYTFPPRKAPPPPHSPRLHPRKDVDSSPAPLVLHSPLSPLTPSSPLYPDGLMSPLWITKHQSRLPAAFVALFTLTADANTSSLQDNTLKSEIANVRNVLSTTNHKTKFIVMLVGDGYIAASELEERVALIRRAAALDAKGLFFLPFGSSHIEIVELVGHILKTISPLLVEYYRDLSKHARRKRNRSTAPAPTVPPTAGTSQVLTSQAWNVRYEFKLGVLAEFRQEMDAACRNYETAYESLFAPEVFDSIPAWSSRFNEARMLSDIIAIRAIRCQLWTGQSTSAVRTWANHRDRTRDLVIRRGTGTDDYAWEAWQSTWSKTMADTLARVEFAALHRDESEISKTELIFTGPEKALPMGERLAPWERLHHEGYWRVQASKHTQRRRSIAMQMPEDDRIPPGQSPASAIARTARLHDSYLALDPHAEFPLHGKPGYDYTQDIISTLEAAIESFSKHDQFRNIQQLQLKQAIEYIVTGDWGNARTLLRPLWQQSSWRRAGWWKLLQEIGWALLECATKSRDLETIIRVEWELSSRAFDSKPTHRYDLHNAIGDLSVDEARPEVALSSENVTPCIIPFFVFANAEGNVSEPLEAQLCLQSFLLREAATIRISEVKIVFEGSLRPIHLLMSGESNEATIEAGVQLIDVQLHDSSTMADRSTKRSSAGAIASLTGNTDLSMRPESTKVFRLTLVPKEAGEVTVASVTLIVEDKCFSLTAITSRSDESSHTWWDMKARTPTARHFAMERDAQIINILPKPPKVSISIPGLRQAYYTNESIDLLVNFVNDEEETALISVDARLVSPLQTAASIRWADQDDEVQKQIGQPREGLINLPRRSMGPLYPSCTTTLSIVISNTTIALDHELEIRLAYCLESDSDTPLAKTHVLEIPIVRPFEANYEFLSCLDARPWPKFFEPPEVDRATDPKGLTQRFNLSAGVYSFASEVLCIERISLTVQGVSGDAVCKTSDSGRVETSIEADETSVAETTRRIRPDETLNFAFDLEMQKMVLGDRDPASVDLALTIEWRRTDTENVTISTLEIPTFVAPMAEPRVLLTVVETCTAPSLPGLRRLMLTIENPSMHFLTFNVNMESSEDFVFSGSKACAISLVPVSRHAVEYRILSNKRGEWVRVALGVVDTYFGKTLKVQPAGKGVVLDRKGNTMVWVD